MLDFSLPLLIVLIAILAAALIRFRFDFMQPSIIFVAALTFSVVMSMLFAERWMLHVGVKTFFCLTLAALAFALGNFFADLCSRTSRPSIEAKKIRIGSAKIFFVLILMSGLLYFNFLESYEMAIELGNEEGLDGLGEMIRINRAAIEAQEATFSRWSNYRSTLAQAITYTFLYAFLHNLIFARSIGLRYLLPLLLYIPMLILNTGRMGLLCLIVYAAVVASILAQRRSSRPIDRLATLKALLGAGVIFAALFMLMGVFTGKTISEDRTPAVIIAHYAGLSIPALDVVLNRELVETPLIGSMTLHGVYRALNTIGISMPNVPLFLPFVSFNSIDTNVYTAEARYVHDYGWLGMILILWSFGAIYSFAYRAVRDRSGALPLMYYGFAAYPLFLSSIDERVMLDLLSTTPIYVLILLLLSKTILIDVENEPAIPRERNFDRC